MRMLDLNFQGRPIGLVDFDDVNVDQRALEFTDPAIPIFGSHVAVVIPDEGSWLDAVVRINPHVPEVPVDFLLWVVEKAREIVHE
ncbi:MULTISPECIES: hypothetical protein [Nocardia]|uniref:hypothetical protein n=1 Tax=Nocardia TaxID=1817 RepID=UPI001041F077|nr:hypothetical protein [Nocardia salmonicida]